MKQKSIRNWWYYYKWYVLIGLILLGILIYIAGNALGIWKRTPDLQIAYVGRAPLPEDTKDALEQAFASVADDYNKDGQVIVQINQYIDSGRETSSDPAYEYGSEIALIGDITKGDSYIFLMDDPESFQLSWHILSAADGTKPQDTDYSTEDKVFLWSQSPVLSHLDLGTYHSNTLGMEETGSSQEWVSGLYVGRRYFSPDKTPPYETQYSQLWEHILPTTQEVIDHET